METTIERDTQLEDVLKYIKDASTRSGQGRIPLLGVLSSSGGGKTHFCDYVAENLLKGDKFFPITITFNSSSSVRRDESDYFANRFLWRLVAFFILFDFMKIYIY